MDKVLEITVKGDPDRANFLSLDSLGWVVRLCLECGHIVNPQGMTCPDCQTEGRMTKLFVKGQPNERLIFGKKGGTIEEVKRTEGREEGQGDSETTEIGFCSGD